MAPALDFDLGAGTSAGTTLPDLSLGDRKEEPSASSPLDFDLGADSTGNGNRTSDFTPEGTLIMDKGAPEKSAGGGLDFITRTVAGKLGERLPVPVIVENVSGANGIIAVNTTTKLSVRMFTQPVLRANDPGCRGRLPAPRYQERRDPRARP